MKNQVSRNAHDSCTKYQQYFPKLSKNWNQTLVSLPGKQHFPSHYTGSLLPEAVIKAIYHHLCSVSSPHHHHHHHPHQTRSYVPMSDFTEQATHTLGALGLYTYSLQNTCRRSVFIHYTVGSINSSGIVIKVHTLYSIAACFETVLKHKLFELLSEF